jgi:hypothetical protein
VSWLRPGIQPVLRWSAGCCNGPGPLGLPRGSLLITSDAGEADAADSVLFEMDLAALCDELGLSVADIPESICDGDD